MKNSLQRGAVTAAVAAGVLLRTADQAIGGEGDAVWCIEASAT